MKAPAMPAEETGRQAALDESGLLDTSAEERFDRFTRLASSALEVPIALVSLIDRNRQWFKSSQGLSATETPRDISFCGHAILQSDVFVIEDTLNDDRFSDNPLVTESPFIRFYAGAPLHSKSGFRLGTLCIIDRKPRLFDDQSRKLLRELADCVEQEMEQKAASDFYRELRKSERRAGAIIQQQNRALGILNELALDPETDDDIRIRKALKLATDYLELPLGIVSEINSQVYSVRWLAAPPDAGLAEGATFPLEETYCSLLLDRKESLAISHMAQSGYRNHSCYSSFGLESYLAAPIFVRDRLFGTLNFASAKPRAASFTETEVTFVTLLARWVAGVLERKFSVQMLTRLVDQTPGALYQYQLWPDGRSAFPFSSPHIRDIYGFESQEIMDDASKVFSTIHPDDIAEVGASIDRSAESLAIWQHQYRVSSKAPDSGWRWVEGKASPERMPDDSIVWHGYIADIDDNKRTELALHESEAQLRNLYELSPIGIALNDFISGKFLEVNDALLAPIGYSREQLLAKDFRQLLPENTKKDRQTMLAELEQTGRFGPIELSIQKSDRSVYPAIVRGIRIKDTSGRSLVWSLVEDISERKKVDRMKNEFISTVSHELRTPLTAITGSLGLIAGGSLGKIPDKMDRMISIAHRNSEHLKFLVDDLLDMEKLVSGKMKLSLSPQKTLPTVQASVDQLAHYANERDVTVRIDGQSADMVAIFDRARLHQACTNLLSNAIKFSPDQGQVSVQLLQQDNRLQIRVSDHGPGVPDSFRSRIFGKFAQADSSATRSKGGTGLGLAITKEIMEQMGGNVGFDSTEGSGATFWLELPTPTKKPGEH